MKENNIYLQLERLFKSMFRNAGFAQEQQGVLSKQIISLWITRAAIRISSEIFKETPLTESVFSEENLITNEEKTNYIYKILSQINPEQQNKILDILFEEAYSLFERMTNKFISAASEEQKNKFRKSLEEILKN